VQDDALSELAAEPFETSEAGRIIKSEANIRRCLAKAGIKLSYDAFARAGHGGNRLTVDRKAAAGRGGAERHRGPARLVLSSCAQYIQPARS
jgi:hypothetical protein